MSRALGVALVSPHSILDRVVSDVADTFGSWRTQRSTRTERNTLPVGSDVYVTSARGWVTEAVIADVTADRLGRVRYLCEYATLGDLTSADGLHTRRNAHVTVSARDVIAWPAPASLAIAIGRTS
jgi:hypothetical protein